MNVTALQEMLRPMTLVTPIDGGLRVSTHCLYPSNGTVSVSVRKFTDSYIVSDDGGCVQEANSAGLQFNGMVLKDIDRKIKYVVKKQGLLADKGAIFSPPISLEAIPAAILLVANASKESASWFLEHMKFVVPRNFKKDVSDLLSRYFNEVNLSHDDEIVGHSNKRHRFGHIIHFSGKKLLIDPVMNDASSIHARVVANLDVMQLEDSGIIQRIVYDDREEWKSSDLRLLEMGATPLPFSNVENEIKQIAA